MEKYKDYGFDTKAIHEGSKSNPDNALNPPIFQTSTFTFDSLEHAEDVMSFKSSDYVYTRGNNPTLRLFENKMAALEEGEGAVAFSSGMAAISSVLFSLLKPNDSVIVHRTLYGSTFSVANTLLPKYGIKCKTVDMRNIDELKNSIDESVKVVYFETPCNPNLEIIDIKEVCDAVRGKNIKVVVDNTFASPYFQRPLTLGADVVVHSATKYICGHGDVVAGVAVSKDIDYINRLKFDYMCEFGGALSPFNAWLLIRGLKTLGVRMREHEKNAIEIAKFLREHKYVKKVYYPGLEDFEGHIIAKKQMKGFSGMVSFEIEGGLDRAKKFVNSLKLIKIAVSLGDCESLIEIPSLITHRGYPEEKLLDFGFSKDLIRISAGLEDIDDIIYDLQQAFKLIND
ncbi:methionine-gamma-lyase [Caloramator quimbayensis]|uniref:homocysteine desulfhydrase n=1 Tax=Caloramator quimbayensis TaxID=1147123 RepID=A0A1T4WJN7_9CLOT|nr:PLP-dependent aspartate aminotransferase family protein [Caloramator quimbayensis]SKA77540.1 methionine-gamma-lyase [Caloramator quimbayensis]